MACLRSGSCKSLHISEPQLPHIRIQMFSKFSWALIMLDFLSSLCIRMRKQYILSLLANLYWLKTFILSLISLHPEHTQAHVHTYTNMDRHIIHHIEEKQQGEKAQHQEVMLWMKRYCIKMEEGRRRRLGMESRAKHLIAGSLHYHAHSWLLVMTMGCEDKKK